MHSLSRWLIGVFAGMFLAVLAGGVWFYRVQEQGQRQEAERTLGAVARLKVSQIVQWRAERLEDATTLQAGAAVLDGFSAYLANPRSEGAEEMRARLRCLGLARQYSDIMLVDARGKVLLSSSGALATLPESMASCLAAACRQRRCVLTDLHVEPGEATPHVDVIVPLPAGGEGPTEAAGAIVLRCDAQRTLYPLIEFYPMSTSSAETLLVRREGDSVLFLNHLRHQADTALKLRIPMTHADTPAVLAAGGKEAVVRGVDYRGAAVLAAVAPVPDSPWFLVAKIDVAEAMAHWRTRSILIVAAVLGLLATVAAATGVLWQRSAKGHYRALFHSKLARRQSEQRHHTTLLSIGDGVITTDSQGRVELLNPVAEALTGWTQDQARGQEVSSVFHIISEETRGEVESPVARVLREGVVVGLANHTLLVSRDGAECPIADSGAPVRDAAGEILGTVLVFRDQSQERKSQAELSRLNRALRAIGECNQVLVRETQEPSLLDEICRIIHEIAGYPVVYVSMARPDGERAARVVAHAGKEEVLLQSLGLAWLDAPAGRGPTGTAIRTGRPCLVRHSDDDARLESWREKMASLGVRSLAAFPLPLGQVVLGAVTIGAADDEAFTPEEIELLGELTSDLAYGIHAIRTREELSGRQATLASIFRAAPVGIAVTDHCVLREVNDALLEIAGYAREELIGQSTRVLYLSDEEFEWVGREERRQMAERGTGTVETRWRRRDGTIVDILIRATSLVPGDLTQGVTFTAMDITSHKRADDALRESLERYRVLFSVVPDTLFLIDVETLRFLDADEAAEKMYGYSRQELRGLSIQDVATEFEIGRQRLQSLSVGQVRQQVITRHRRKDGTLFPVEITERCFLLEGRRRVFSSVRDISERRRAEEERAALEELLRQSQRLESIGRLAGGVAHDFNNLLTPILGYCQLLRDPAVAPELRADGLEQIHQAALRAKELTMQLLAFGRKQIMEFQSVDLRCVVDSVVRLLRRTLREDIRLETRLPATLSPIRADAMQMEQVLMNLAVNAQDAMARGGVLTIELAEVALDDADVALIKNPHGGRYVLMSVSDTGVGIAPADLGHIFEPFFTTKEKGKGVGLGLATVFGIVKQHGGGISAYSEPGQGSTFKVYLPVAEGAVTAFAADTEATLKTAPDAQGGTETILVVEDHEAVLAMIKRMLALQGYRVIAAQGPAECLQIIRAGKDHIHLMLTDVMMAGMNGRELYEQVSVIRPGLKVIYMSGHTESVIAHHGVLDEGIAFLQKPFSTEAVLRKIRQMLDA